VLGANLAADRFKPFDYFLTNYFYQLEGKKFSTSRLHVIWAADIVNKTKASSDAVRYYLISRSPETQESNFDIQDFIQFNNAFLVEDFSRLLSMVWSNWEIAVQNPIPESLKLDLEKAFTEQANCWEPPAQELLKGLQVLEQWLQSVAASSDWQSQPYWMLKSISLMCYPIMPKMSQEIWTLLGAEGAPATATFLQLSSPEAKTELPIFFETITYEDLLPCLPATLTEKSSENGHPIAKPKVKLDFMAPWFEADAIKVEEVDLTQDKERFAPFKASRFEVFPGKTSPVDIHEVRECWFISEGQGSLIYNGEKLQEVKAGEVLYFDSHQSHAIENTGDSNLVIFSTWWKP
ncbi:MAG: class I tRNA ligase family protein, partial [Bacteroidota bacterium]